MKNEKQPDGFVDNTPTIQRLICEAVKPDKAAIRFVNYTACTFGPLYEVDDCMIAGCVNAALECGDHIYIWLPSN